DGRRWPMGVHRWPRSRICRRGRVAGCMWAVTRWHSSTSAAPCTRSRTAVPTRAPACRKEPSIRRAAPSPVRGTRASFRSTRARCWAVHRRFRSLPIGPLGLGIAFSAGEGPQITRPIREAGQVLELPPVDPATDLAYVMEAARAAAQALPAHIPLIGFAGAPFTLASYAIEGGATRTFALTKRFMYNEPRAWHELMQRFAELVGGYLAGQARAGARALQLF